VDISSPILIPFLVPIAFVIFMLVVQSLLLLVAGIGLDFDADTDLDVDADLDLDVDLGVDVDADLGLGLDADLDLDLDVDADLDADVDSDFSIGKILAPIGVGQVPLSVVWNAYALSFGVSGIGLCFLLTKFFALAAWFLWLAIPLSMVVGWYCTKYATRLVAPLLKTSGAAECKSDIVGRVGRVTSTLVDGSWGEVVININGQSNHMIVKSDGEVIERDSEIVVIDYDAENKRPIVGKIKA